MYLLCPLVDKRCTTLYKISNLLFRNWISLYIIFLLSFFYLVYVCSCFLRINTYLHTLNTNAFKFLCFISDYNLLVSPSNRVQSLFLVFILFFLIRLNSFSGLWNRLDSLLPVCCCLCPDGQTECRIIVPQTIPRTPCHGGGGWWIFNISLVIVSWLCILSTFLTLNL